MGLFKKEIEEFPASHASGGLGPDIWTVYASIAYKASLFQAFLDDGCISKVVVYKCPALFSSLFGKSHQTTCLGNIGGTVEVGALSSVPKAMDGTCLGIIGLQAERNDCPAKSYTCETCVLAE